jgi:hypothetical protein
MELLCGGTATVVSKSALAPFERIKVIMQTQTMRTRDPFLIPYRNVLRSMSDIARTNGLRSLWRGNAANVLRNVPHAALTFTIYDIFKNALMPQGESNYGWFSAITRECLAGGLCGATTLAITYPLDLARTRLMADINVPGKPPLYKGLMDCCYKTIRYEGMRGLYKGVGISIAGIVPYLGFSFASFEHLKYWFEPDQTKSYYPMVIMAIGATSSLCAQTISYPLDTIRKRLQMNGEAGQPKVFRNLRHCVRLMLNVEGLSSFYFGFSATVIKTIPSAAVQFMIYEYVRNWMLKQ